MASCLDLGGCGSSQRCGPPSGIVASVIDGDTVVLKSGETIRYLLVDTPEITNGHNDCFGDEASALNSDLTLDQAVTLDYDSECTDAYERLLAYVSVQGREVNSLLVERGYACVLFIPPNGADRVSEFSELEELARAEGRGMWAACDPVSCD